MKFNKYGIAIIPEDKPQRWVDVINEMRIYNTPDAYEWRIVK